LWRPDTSARRVDRELLNRVCERVAAWLDRAAELDRTTALEALHVAERAIVESATVISMLPIESPEKLWQPNGVPFRVEVEL